MNPVRMSSRVIWGDEPMTRIRESRSALSAEGSGDQRSEGSVLKSVLSLTKAQKLDSQQIKASQSPSDIYIGGRGGVSVTKDDTLPRRLWNSIQQLMMLHGNSPDQHKSSYELDAFHDGADIHIR